MDVLPGRENGKSCDRNETGTPGNIVTVATLCDWGTQGNSKTSTMLSDCGALKWVDRWRRNYLRGENKSSPGVGLYIKDGRFISRAHTPDLRKHRS